MSTTLSYIDFSKSFPNIPKVHGTQQDLSTEQHPQLSNDLLDHDLEVDQWDLPQRSVSAEEEPPKFFQQNFPPSEN